MRVSSMIMWATAILACLVLVSSSTVSAQTTSTLSSNTFTPTVAISAATKERLAARGLLRNSAHQATQAMHLTREPEFDQLSAWDRFPEIAERWDREPLTPEQYREFLRTDDALYRLSEHRATFFHELASLPGLSPGRSSMLMVASGTGEQLTQLPGPEAAGGKGFATVYFTDGNAGSVDLALELALEIFANHSGSLVVSRSLHPTLRYSNRPQDAGRMAPVFRVVARRGEAPVPAHNFGPETWAGLTIVFAQAWSNELPQLFRGLRVDVVADVWGLCSFRDALGYARDLQRFRAEHGAQYIGYLEHGVLRGNPDRTNEALYRVRKEHFGKIACDPARDMETIVGKQACGGDYSLRVFRQGVQFYWFIHPRPAGVPERDVVDFLPKVGGTSA